MMLNTLHRVVAAIAVPSALAATMTAAPAHAGYFCDPINGTFTLFSDGQWAQTREVYHDEASVHDTWTISSDCTDAFDCSGDVVSAQGWKSGVHCLSGVWTVRRNLDGWEPCPDGSAVSGTQLLQFWTDRAKPGSYTGLNKTIGPSGGCGVNLPLTVQMPLKLDPAQRKSP